MYTVLNIDAYGYFPMFIGSFIILFLLFILKNNIFHNVIVLLFYFISFIIGVFYNQPLFPEEKTVFGTFWKPTIAELVVNTSTFITIASLLIRTEFKVHSFFITILSLLSILLYTSDLIYVLFCDLLGIYIAVILYFVIIKIFNIKLYLYCIVYLVFVIFCGVKSTDINWNFINKDLRPAFLIYLDWKQLMPEDYYICNNIEDSEQRFRQIYEVINKPTSDITLIFLEDSTAAYSFKRSSIGVTWDGDYVYTDSKVGRLKLQKHDSLLVGDIKYKLANVYFAIKVNNNNELIAMGSFRELSFSVLCAFQKFLDKEIFDLTDYKISLYNNENVFKIGIRYYTSDEYKLYLDKSFL